MESTLILVVEDNLANQMLAYAVLARDGFKVDLAGTSSEALACINGRLPDLILMDIQLPGEDGLQLTRRLKTDPSTSAIPIVAVTANAMNGDREATLAAGCDGYIAKPIDTRTFASVVRKFLPAGQRADDRDGVGETDILSTKASPTRG